MNDEKVIQELVDAPYPKELQTNPVILLDGLWLNDTHDPFDYKCDAMAYLVACINVPGFNYAENINVLHSMDSEKLDYIVKFQNNSAVGPKMTTFFDNNLDEVWDLCLDKDSSQCVELRKRIAQLNQDSPLLIHARHMDLEDIYGKSFESAKEVFSDDSRVKSRKSVYDISELVK